MVRRTPIAAGSRRGQSTIAAASEVTASTVNCAAYSAFGPRANGPAAAHAAIAAIAYTRTAGRDRPARVPDRRHPQQHAVRGLEEQVEGEADLPVAAAGDEERGEGDALDDPRRHPVAEIRARVVALEQHEEEREDDGPGEVRRGGDFERRHCGGRERIIG